MKKQITFSEALLTAIGSVIGSGIFFRASRILVSSQGHVTSAILGWLVLGGTLVFAGLATSILAERTKKTGGLTAYVEDAYGPVAGFAVGWFNAVVYIPAMIGILGYVAAEYAFQLVGIDPTVSQHYLFVAVIILTVYLWNFLSTKFAAKFSSFSTVVKVFPLITIAILGFIGLGASDWANISGGAGFVAGSEEAMSLIANYDPNMSMLALFAAPLLSMAFAFDGWITVGTLSVDMENPQRDLAKVFALNALIVTLVYTSYFTAVNLLMPADEIIINGNGHVGIIANDLFTSIGGAGLGAFAESAIIACVVISVLGTLNGNVMGGFRYFRALAERQDLPGHENIAKLNEKTNTAVNAGFVSLATSVVLFTLYYLQSAKDMFAGIAFDDLPIALLAIVFILLFANNIKTYFTEKNGNELKLLIAPIIAILGQAFVVVSFFINNDQALFYLIVSIIVIAIGIGIRTTQKNNR